MHFFEPLFDTSQSHQNIMFICFLIGAYYFYEGASLEASSIITSPILLTSI